MERKQFRPIGLLLMALCILVGGRPVMAQDISQIAKSDPLIITGAVGTNNTYYYSSISSGYASPLTNSAYANLNINIYGFSMPFSLYYSNNNLGFNYPTFSFNISPSYKNWRLHIGQRSMAFSSYTFNLPFNGIGLEYNGNKLRFGTFYGALRNAVNDDPYSPTARPPQYKRMAWGARFGVGTSTNYLDLYLLRAWDSYMSISDGWHNIDLLEQRGMHDPFAQENIVVGLKGRVSLKNWAAITANASGSVFSTDVNAGIIELPRFRRWDKIFDVRYSTLARFAGDAALNLNFGPFAAAFQYKMIQPDYTSMGISYVSNNLQSLGVSMNTTLFKRLALSGSFSAQEDNLSNVQMYTTRGFVYDANGSMSLGKYVNLAAHYNGYLQRQYDGAYEINDSIRVNRRMDSYSFGPTFSFSSSNASHTISLSGSYTSNLDLNPFTNNNHETDVNTLSAGASYGLGLQNIETNISTSYSHQQSMGYGTLYSTDVVSVGASHAFLEDKTLNASFTVSCCFNNMIGQTKKTSIGADASLGYTLKQVHVFSFSAGYNTFNDINITVDEHQIGRDLSLSLNYSYAFTLYKLKLDAEGM